jgi:hypothetical protein
MATTPPTPQTETDKVLEIFVPPPALEQARNEVRHAQDRDRAQQRTEDAALPSRIVALLEAILAEQVKQRELLEEIATRLGR